MDFQCVPALLRGKEDAGHGDGTPTDVDFHLTFVGPSSV